MRSIHLMIFVLIAFIANAQTTTNDWSKRIVSKTKRPFASFISPHVGSINVLIIDGKRFEHVRGLKKFYLPVPKTNSIVFVTDDEYYRPTYHIFNMDTDEDIAIHTQSSMSLFGETIGSDNSEDTVEKADDGNIVLCNLDDNLGKGAKSTLQSLANLYSVKELIYLDVEKKAVVADKTFYYDKAGNVIEERDASPPF